MFTDTPAEDISNFMEESKNAHHGGICRAIVYAGLLVQQGLRWVSDSLDNLADTSTTVQHNFVGDETEGAEYEDEEGGEEEED